MCFRIACCAALVLFLSAPASADTPLFTGPDAASDKPFIVDSLGIDETQFRAWAGRATQAKPARWAPKLSFYVHYKAAQSSDAVLATIYRGRKRLGKPIVCQAKKTYPKANLIHYECDGRQLPYEKQFDSKGKHTVKLTYKDVVGGKQFKDFATLNVVVEELKKGAQNDPSRSWGESHDERLRVSTIEDEVSGSGSNAAAFNALESAKRNAVPHMTVRTWLKREKRPERTQITCLFGGNKIAEGSATRGLKFESWSYKRKGKPDRINQNWTQVSYRLFAMHPGPDAKGSKGSYSGPQHYLNENPGDYKCVITGGGEIIKELFFQVGKDGAIVRSDCQTKAVNALRTVTLIKSSDKKLSTVPYDKRAGSKTAFEGRAKWPKGCPL